jgi:hypothetical protein
MLFLQAFMNNLVLTKSSCLEHHGIECISAISIFSCVCNIESPPTIPTVTLKLGSLIRIMLPVYRGPIWPLAVGWAAFQGPWGRGLSRIFPDLEDSRVLFCSAFFRDLPYCAYWVTMFIFVVHTGKYSLSQFLYSANVQWFSPAKSANNHRFITDTSDNQQNPSM